MARCRARARCRNGLLECTPITETVVPVTGCWVRLRGQRRRNLQRRRFQRRIGDMIQKPHREPLGRRDGASRQHHAQGLLRTDQPWQPLRRPGGGDQSQRHLGEANLRIGLCDAGRRGQSYGKAGAKGRAMQSNHDRLRAHLDRLAERFNCAAKQINLTFNKPGIHRKAAPG